MTAVCTTTGHISDIRHQNRWWRGGIRYVGNKCYENKGLSNCGGMIMRRTNVYGHVPNKATIMLPSSIQATLAGRFGNSEYGRSKSDGCFLCAPIAGAAVGK